MCQHVGFQPHDRKFRLLILDFVRRRNILDKRRVHNLERMLLAVGDGIYDADLVQTIRELIGNPFRLPSFSPAWRTSTAVQLARQMYDSRDFSLMPILADALQDAGCENEDILNHCRGESLHVRGCWVVDLVLEKA